MNFRAALKESVSTRAIGAFSKERTVKQDVIKTEQISRVERITPDLAAQYLETNTGNRKIKRSAVASYARAMKRGLWELNGEAIVFDADGKLMNGQNRLNACIQAQVPFDTWVTRGVRRTAMPTLDSGVNRSVADFLSIQGQKMATRMAAGARLLMQMSAQTNKMNSKLSNAEVVEFISRHPKLEAAALRTELMTKMGVTPSIAVAWFYLAAYVAKQPELAEAAARVLETGIPSYEKDAIHAYRERVIQMRARGLLHAGGSGSRMVMMWTLMGCWNFFIHKEPLQWVRLRKTPVDMENVKLGKL